ncbi:MAG: DUF882 domain-containing protein [Paracoccaceae bacterium]|nr:DUF882 domain-containing protein [Paracoccaceae bacterium]MDE3121129.1 DUF882 domain-containing protein [Paracoccaceae bacterium]MDE3238785.1 DUF882 domain-containing protein [Paracoccaceae bacterium]
MTQEPSSGMTRRGLLRVFAASTVAAAPTYANAFGLLRGAGNVRRVRMYSGRSGESLDAVYWVEGQYIPEVMKQINYFMRDWRVDEQHVMAPQTVDIIAATHKLLDTSEPYMLLSGYRSAATNALLRRQSRGVALHSLHIPGEAADLTLKTRSVHQIYNAAWSCQAGGVGKYIRSDFVHMDCGPVRTWHG